MLRIFLGLVVTLAVAGSAFAIDPHSQRKLRKAQEAQESLVAASEAYGKKEFAEAIKAATKAIDSESLPPAMMGNAFALRGAAYQQTKDCKSALPDLEKAVILLPDESESKADIHVIKGVCMAELKVGDLGEGDFSRAIALNPKNATAYSARCVTYYQANQYDKALADCEMAVKLAKEGNRTDLQSMRVVASSLHHLDRKAEALTAWKAVLAADPNDESAKKAIEQLSKP